MEDALNEITKQDMLWYSTRCSTNQNNYPKGCMRSFKHALTVLKGTFEGHNVNFLHEVCDKSVTWTTLPVILPLMQI